MGDNQRMGALRYNEDKPEVDYLACWYDALCEVAEVSARNCDDNGGKYPAGNFLKGQSDRQLLQSALRHLLKEISPHYDDHDEEDECREAAKCVWNLLQYLQNIALRERGEDVGCDDRIHVPTDH